MSAQTAFIWLAQLSAEHNPLVGTKAATLGELTRLGLPVPNGFVITDQVWRQFLDETKLDKKLSPILNKAKGNTGRKLQEVALVAQELILHADLPETIHQHLIHNYQQLASKDVHVTVRQDSKSYPNIIGPKQLERAVKQLWADQFSAKAIHLRQQQDLEHFESVCSIIVQRTVEAEVSGMSFTINPLTQNADTVSIEAIWGLGDPINEGQLTPDYYEVNKADWIISKKNIVRQEWQLTSDPDKQSASTTKLDAHNLRLPVSVGWQRKQKLSDRLIVDLARLSVRLQENLGSPQQIEWAYADHTLFILQSDDIVWATDPQPDITVTLAQSTAVSPSATPLLIGVAASPGVATGQVKIIKKPEDINKIKADTSIIAVLDDADIDPDPGWNPPVAIVANQGGRTASAALIARENGIPAVVGVQNGQRMLKDGETITVDGYSGNIYQGDLAINKNGLLVTTANAHLKNSADIAKPRPQVASYLDYQTATKIMVNISSPDQAALAASKNIDGVGLLRSEYFMQNIGTHPRYLIDNDKTNSFIDTLAKSISDVVAHFGTKPVIYRLSDLTANQLANLDHGYDYETKEDNPALGYRGAYRHANQQTTLDLELQAIKKVRATHKNLWVMVPFIRTPQELIEIKHQMSQAGLHRSGTFKLFMMAEVPANVIMLEQFIGVGIDGISIGSNDLTQLMLGVDRHNPQVASQFDERNEAVMWALEKLIRGAAAHGILSSIAGQAPSVYPELTKKLVEWGISSISVSPEAVTNTRQLVAEAEYELVRQGKKIKKDQAFNIQAFIDNPLTKQVLLPYIWLKISKTPTSL